MAEEKKSPAAVEVHKGPHVSQPALKTFEDYSPTSHNIIYPSRTIQAIRPLQQVVLEEVTVNTDPQKGDIFKVGNRKDEDSGGNVDVYALAKPALEAISHAAGIVWDPNTTRRIDDGKNPRRVEFQATGALRKPDGSSIVVTKTKEIDLDALEEEARANLEALGENGKLWKWGEEKGKKIYFKKGTPELRKEIELRVQDKMIQLKKHKVRLADTGAANAVIRAILGLKPNYTLADLKKPFVIPHITMNMSFVLADPTLKQEMVRQLMNSNSIFGPAQQPAQIAAPVQQLPAAEEDDTPIMLETSSEVEQTESTVTAEPEQKGEPKISKTEYMASWTSESQEGRNNEIARLLKLKNLAWPAADAQGDPPAFEKMEVERQVKAMWHYLNLPTPDKEKEASKPKQAWD